MPEHDILARWIERFGFVLIIAILIIALSDATCTQAQSQAYMQLTPSSSGYLFDCLDTYPYTEQSRMQWNADTGFTELAGQDYTLTAQLIAVADYNVTNIYTLPDGRLFAWGFTCPTQETHNRIAIHVDRGAWWISNP